MEPWCSEATRVSSLEAEICFLVQDDFYYGPDRLANLEDRQKFLEHLVPPDIPRLVPSIVRTSEALGNELKLAAYYEQIVCLARKHKLTFNSVRQYFWLRFWLWNPEQQLHISFPWYDSFSEIDRFLNNLAKAEDGLVDHDVEQGWEMEAYAHEGMLYIRQRDPDADETHLAICVPRQELVAQLGKLSGRTSKIIAHLASTVGADVWTSYVRTEPSFQSKCS
jgi:hypothetical protein